MICLICGNNGEFGYFEEPDHKGISGMFVHIKGDKKERHFVTLEQLHKTEWFEDFLIKRQKETDKNTKEMELELEKSYLYLLEEDA